MTRPSFSRSHPWRSAAVCGLLALVAVACGSPSPDAQVQAGEGGVPVVAASGDATLPTLPPIAERRPSQFTPEGCAVTSAGPDCSVEAAAIDDAQQGGVESDWRVLAGFSGTRWSDTATGSTTVLEDTVTVAGPAWQAMGLVRNDSGAPVADLVVRATLLDAAGAEIETVEAPVGLPVVRAGEPVPFVLVSEVALGEVSTVRWSTTSQVPEAEPARDLEFAVYWQRPTTDVRPVDTSLYQDPADGTRAHVVFGAATAVGPEPVEGLVVLGAWLDDGGRVVAVEDAVLGAESAAVGTSVDLLLVADGPVLGDVDQADLALWGTGA